MSHKMSSYSFIKLPLTIAVTSLLVSACSNTAPVKNPNNISHVPITKPTTAKPSTTKSSTTKPPATTTTPSQTSTTITPPVQVQQPSPTEATTGYSNALLDDESLDELENLLEATDMSMVEDDKIAIQQYGDLWRRLRAGFRMDQSQYGYNPRIEAQKNWFISRQDYLNRLSARASRYLYHTVREAERRNIPTELALLPVIESSYDPTATSNAAAAGLWQFIPSTGRIYGLNQSISYDGRRDVIESTRAAYDFLTTLHNQFGSWELALAAYNAGPGRIQKAIDANAAKGLPTDFWSLDLPTETRNYVPRFLAVAQIVNNPDQYGIYLPAIANRQHFRSVPINYGVSLQQVAQLAGVSYDELSKLNPALIAGQVDVSGPKRVIIPNSVNITVDNQISALGSNGMVAGVYSPQTYNSNEELSKSPQELAKFAQNARVPSQTTSYIEPVVTSSQRPTMSQNEVRNINAELAKSNNLPTTSAEVTPNRTIIQEPPLTQEEKEFIASQIRQQDPQVNEVVSSVDGNIKLSAVQTQQSVLEAKNQEKKIVFNNNVPTKPKPQGKRSVYRVQRGDTLSNIASRAGVSWRDIAEWNQIDPNATLLAGSTLYLYNARPIAPLSSVNNTSTPSNTQATASNSRPDSYIVRSGDTLIGTANQFGLSPSQLASYNNMATNEQLIIGQRLWLIPGKVTSSAPTATQTNNISESTYFGKTTTYTVRSGETLIGLSNKYGVSLSTLAAMNDLATNAGLYIGQKLTVPATSQAASSSSSSSASTNYSGPTSTYRVKAGDTLIGIANDLGVSRDDIAALNSFGANARLQRGSIIKVPASRQEVDLNLHNKSVTYKVSSGDTLIGVAKRFDVSVSDLAAANDLSTNAQLILGRSITIPAKGSVPQAASNTASAGSSTTGTRLTNTTSYTVKSGDTLIGLASRYNVSLSDLATTNDLQTNEQLRIGQKLKVPASSGNTQSTASSSSSSSAEFKNAETYTVKSGDTLIGLAKRYGVSTSDLASANGISSNTMLQRGQRIKVPQLTTTYRVKSGDSLIGLAGRYGISASELAAMNDLASNAQLQIGQKLTVPNR
ncbi:LysM peptidoglycan-binding domain-containing protein [Psychrobacter sp. I-STPA10]|uniref:LysM peptidoglycan-binding domain-containing protein n=1 Tax=Psychrobacter sp. I-STPA10 TaxID=2585769 RepID=UPI001E4612C2|nr:LysM peptidoglycan-binding domain-containing protein [Psychrobacter sp. I-STPA10]